MPLTIGEVAFDLQTGCGRRTTLFMSGKFLRFIKINLIYEKKVLDPDSWLAMQFAVIGDFDRRIGLERILPPSPIFQVKVLWYMPFFCKKLLPWQRELNRRR